MSKEDWVEQWVKCIPEPKPGSLDKVDEHDMAPNQDSAAGLPNKPNAEERDVCELQTWDMVELAQRGDLLSTEIRAAQIREEELVKRVKEKQSKISEKRNSVIMLNNVLKMKREELANLRKRGAAGGCDAVETSTQQLPPTGWQSRNPLSSRSPVMAGAGLRESGRWRENYFEEVGDGKAGHFARMNLAQIESGVEMGRRTGLSLTENETRDDLDQESRDWLARRHLKREKTWDSKKSSNVGNRSSLFKRTLSEPSVGKAEPEVGKSVGTSEWNSSLRRRTPHPPSGRHCASMARCYSCHEPGHFVRDCSRWKETAKLHTPRSTSSMVHMRRRSYQDGGIAGYMESRTLRDAGTSRPSLQTSDLQRGNADQLSRSEVGHLENKSTKQVGAPRSWAKFTMDGMIADILSKREQ